jgi:hypothetical protein
MMVVRRKWYKDGVEQEYGNEEQRYVLMKEGPNRQIWGQIGDIGAK